MDTPDAEPTAADAASVPQIGHILRATKKPVAAHLDLNITPFEDRFPFFAGWSERCTKLPGFDRTHPDSYFSEFRSPWWAGRRQDHHPSALRAHPMRSTASALVVPEHLQNRHS